jgi:hypothetical protein
VRLMRRLWPVSVFSADQPGLGVEYLANHYDCGPASPSAAEISTSLQLPISTSPEARATDAPTRYFDGAWHPLPTA